LAAENGETAKQARDPLGVAGDGAGQGIAPGVPAAPL